MTYSPLTDEVMPPTGKYRGGPKWSPRPPGKIRGLNVHHHATTGTGGITRLVKSSDPASANYIIRTSGALIGSVPEEYRAWTTSSAAADNHKITVEIQNSTGAPEWRISDAAFATLVRLYADLAKRHGFAPTRANLKGHQEYGVATACPGPYLLPRLGQVAADAAALISGATHVDKPVVTTPTTTSEVTVNVTLPKLRPGSRGAHVRLLQGVLNVHGAGTAAGVGVLDEDGSFGAKTDRALRAHQEAHRIDVDGVAGADSWRTLLEDVPA